MGWIYHRCWHIWNQLMSAWIYEFKLSAQEHSYPASYLGIEIIHPPLYFLEHKLRGWFCTLWTHYCTSCQEAWEGGQVLDRFVWCPCTVLPWHSAPGGFTGSGKQYTCAQLTWNTGDWCLQTCQLILQESSHVLIKSGSVPGEPALLPSASFITGFSIFWSTTDNAELYVFISSYKFLFVWHWSCT